MEQCSRCGIEFEFDSARFRPGAPCEDCIWVEGSEEEWGLKNKYARRYSDDDFVRLAKRNYTDPEIAEELGCSKQTAYRKRKKLGIPAQPNLGFERIKNKDAAREWARVAWERGVYDKTRTGSVLQREG